MVAGATGEVIPIVQQNADRGSKRERDPVVIRPQLTEVMPVQATQPTFQDVTI